MSWGPSDELEYREAREAERSRRRAERNWWTCGVWEDGADGDRPDPDELETPDTPTPAVAGASPSPPASEGD